MLAPTDNCYRHQENDEFSATNVMTISDPRRKRKEKSTADDSHLAVWTKSQQLTSAGAMRGASSD